MPYTDIWTKPSGIVHSLNTPTVRLLIQFEDGDHIYPTDYLGKEDPRNVFLLSLSDLQHNWILNPPYNESVLLQHIRFWLRVAVECDVSICLILPHRPEKSGILTF